MQHSLINGILVDTMAKRVLDRFDLEAEREGKAFAKHLIHHRISKGGRLGKKIRKERTICERVEHQIDCRYMRKYVVGSE